MPDGSEKTKKDAPEEKDTEAPIETPEEETTETTGLDEIVSLLTNIPGVGPKTAEKLAESGYDSILKVSEADKEALAAAVVGLSEAKADAVIGEAFDLQEKIDSGEIDLNAKAKSKRKKAPEPEPDRHELAPIEEITRAEERTNLITGYDEDKAAIGVDIGPKWLTKYEKARIVGARALQISMGAPVMIDMKGKPMGRFGFAEEELRAGVLPMTVRRTLPTGEHTDVPLSLLLKYTRLE
jgi:DNA-directed RNA polymerase subunit K/omega/predicted flap endonuclease-1-like 5' DNA nuclease